MSQEGVLTEMGARENPTEEPAPEQDLSKEVLSRRRNHQARQGQDPEEAVDLIYMSRVGGTGLECVNEEGMTLER